MSSKVNILFSSFPDFSGNSKALFEYINSSFGENFNMYWVLYSEKLIPALERKHINCVVYQSPEYNELIKKINIIFDTNGFLFSEKRPDLIYVNLWHGFGPKKAGYLLEQDTMAPNDMQYCELAKRKTDFMVVPSEFAKPIFASLFNINAHRVLPLGYPRLDYLLTSDGKKNLQKITDKDIYSFNKIIFYLPTFRNGCNRKDTDNIFESNLLNLEKYDENTLLKFLEENNYLLAIKKHPAEADLIKNIKSDNILVIEDDVLSDNLLTIYEILNAADMMIADYSSIYLEFLTLDRPVLFLLRDLDEYTKTRGIIFNNNEVWFPGPNTDNINVCLSDIQKLLTDSSYYNKERIDFKNFIMGTKLPNASKDIFEYFFSTTDFSLKFSPYVSPEDKLEAEIADLKNIINQKDFDIGELKYKITSLNNYIQILEDTRTKLQDKLDLIHNSRSWKLIELAQKLKPKSKRKLE